LCTFREEHVDEIIDIFKIKVDLTEKYLETPNIVFYKVKTSSKALEAFIVDSPEAILLACMPHIVSNPFKWLNYRLAIKVSCLINDIMNKEELTPVFVHVLRAAPGYMLHTALKHKNPHMREYFIRPRYIHSSFRNHTERRLEIVYENLENLPSNSDLIVVKPDTEATGTTGLRVLETLVEKAGSKGSTIEALILYGFISNVGLKQIYEKAVKLGVKRVYAFILVDLTALASNKYDMVLYGPDVSYYRKRGEVKFLGALTSRETLEKCLLFYLPGMDQPGDWSARQNKLFNGEKFEEGNIMEHLVNSLKTARNIYEISKKQNWFKPFHDVAFNREIHALEKMVQRMQYMHR